MVLNFKRIGQRIRVIRKAQQLTQAELAEMLSGCTASEQQFLLGFSVQSRTSSEYLAAQ